MHAVYVVGWVAENCTCTGPRRAATLPCLFACLVRPAGARPSCTRSQPTLIASSQHRCLSIPQETCTKLVAQQQLCHEQQEELQFLRLKYQQLSARLEAAEAGGAGPGARTKAQQLQQQGRGSQGGSTGRSARLLLQATLERDSPASSAGSTPTGSRLRRTGSGSSAGGGGASANGGGSKLGSWLGLRR